MTEKSLTDQVNSVMTTLIQDIKNNKLELPSPPDLLIQIRAITNAPNTTAKDIADLIKHDINISGRLIKVANSALFGVRNQIDTVQSAITRLGHKKVQSLITGLIIGQQLMQSKTRGLEHYCTKAWQDSNDVAALSYVLASKKSKIDPEQALLAGMVHNIGSLPIILKLNKIDDLKNNSHIMKLVANIVIPKLYAQAGTLIMTSWNFPPEITAIASSHQDLNHSSSASLTLSDIVLLSYQLNKMDSYQQCAEQIPEKLVQSSSFNKLWTSRNRAAEELKELNSDIEKIKYGITH